MTVRTVFDNRSLTLYKLSLSLFQLSSATNDHSSYTAETLAIHSFVTVDNQRLDVL